MYQSIYIPVDNSDYSNVAIDIGTAFAKQFGARIIGSHAYAAKLHDKRFKQMEAGLPEEYHDETELERQRKIHDSLITRGLEIITDSYLDIVERKCNEGNVPLERRSLEGKNFKVIVEDILQNGYDLVIMGVLGVGAVRESVIGSVTERTIRRVRKSDIFVVKETVTAPPKGKIVVAVDGSQYAFGGFKTALELAKAFDLQVDVVSAFDPYFHYAMFSSISGVLSEEAGKVFRFKEQEKLHEEVIDSGLAKIYQSHLEICETVAKDEGVKIKTALLDGKPFEKVLQYVQREKPWLLIVGRIGVHSDDEMDVGSNSENLIRMAPSNVLVSNRKFIPPIDAIAEYTVAWTEEASKRMEKVPVFARGMAKTAVYRYALEKGHTIISNSVVDAAIGEILPKGAMEAMKALGQTLDAQGIDRNKMTASEGVAETLSSGGMAGMMTQIVGNVDPAKAAFYEDKSKLDFYICNGCGYTARGAKPVQCPVCNAQAEAFQFLDKTIFEAAAKAEGGLVSEVGYDGVPLSWTEEAKNVIRKVPAGFERRRAKAKTEKMARKMGFTTITAPFATRMIEGGDDEEAIQFSSQVLLKEVGQKDPAGVANAATESITASASPHPSLRDTLPRERGREGERVDAIAPTVATSFTYSADAEARLAQVPVGFMRDATRQHVENYAHTQKVSHITLEITEAGIEKAKEEMEAVLSGAVSIEDIKKRLAKMALGTHEKEPTFYFCGVCSHIVREVPDHCPVCQGVRAKFIAMQKEVDYFICNLCNQIAQNIPDHCSLCGSGREHYRKLTPSELKTEDIPVIWTEAARQRLSEIPKGFFRDMTCWRIEVDARKKGISTIDPTVIDAKYRDWSKISYRPEFSLGWEDEATARILRIPSFVQGTVIREIESHAKENGIGLVTASLMDQLTERWSEAIKHQGY